MDEPYLFVRDGAFVHQIPLTQLLVMVDASREIADGAIVERHPDAVATAEAVMRQQNRGQAAVSAFLLQHYMGRAQERVQARTVVAQESVAGEAPPAAGTGAAASSSAAATGPCNHPPDVACPNCAQSHMAARNARKRSGARA